MLWRTIATVAIWILGFSFVLSDGQAFRNAITMLVTVLTGSLPWINLVFSKSGTRGRLAAIVIVFLSAVVAIWIAIGLPEAYEFQARFNEQASNKNQVGVPEELWKNFLVSWNTSTTGPSPS